MPPQWLFTHCFPASLSPPSDPYFLQTDRAHAFENMHSSKFMHKENYEGSKDLSHTEKKKNKKQDKTRKHIDELTSYWWVGGIVFPS